MQLTVRRKEKILRRLSEMGGMKILEQVFRKMEASDFLKGNNKAGWKATFDWVFQNTDNWVKILEGNYDNPIVKPANDARFTGMLQPKLNLFYYHYVWILVMATLNFAKISFCFLAHSV
jgi:hypothetical protein